MKMNMQMSSVSPLKTDQPWWKKLMSILFILFIGNLISWPWLWHQTFTPRPKTPGQWTYDMFSSFSLFRRKGAGRFVEDTQRCLPQLRCWQGESCRSTEGRAYKWIWRWSSLPHQLLGPETCQRLWLWFCWIWRKVERSRRWTRNGDDGRMF